MKDLESPASVMIDRYKAAVLARDVDAFIALYRPDVRIFDVWGVWSYEGAAAWRPPVQEWLAAHSGESVELCFDELKPILRRSHED